MSRQSRIMKGCDKLLDNIEIDKPSANPLTLEEIILHEVCSGIGTPTVLPAFAQSLPANLPFCVKAPGASLSHMVPSLSMCAIAIELMAP